ncbi:DUF4405 domain-containing protein [Kordiimonas sp.]|uniref:DUF4405 domain-containing protein n=1 Tax=Kordiimonas sp. TaxID=1970157 RepID=UPI003A94A39D
MNKLFLVRLALDLTGAGLFLVALAYYWLSNAAHEIIGAILFGLLFLHNGFNRRWYGTIHKRRLSRRNRITTGLNLCLLMIMLILLVSSVIVSRDVFGFLGIEGGLPARDVHMLAAYLALIIVSLHLGMHWYIIMGALNAVFGITERRGLRTFTMRLITFGVAACGVLSSFEMTIGSKLVLYYSMDVWDFRNDAFGFFIRYASIVGLYASLAHYTMIWVRNKDRPASRAGARFDKTCGETV